MPSRIVVNGKRLTEKQTELYTRLMETNPDFRAKVDFLSNGGTFRFGGVRKTKFGYTYVD